MSIDNGQWVKLGVGIMVLEFILLHSGGFLLAGTADLNWRDKKTWKAVLGMIALYGLFVFGISMAFKTWMFAGVFILVMLGRLSSHFFQPEQSKYAIQYHLGLSIMLYLGAVFASVFIKVPRGGITYGILNDVYPDRGSGHWETHPQQALFAGVLYFGVLGLLELRLALKPPVDPKKRLAQQEGSGKSEKRADEIDPH